MMQLPILAKVDLSESGRKEEALEAFNQAIFFDPHLALAYINKGNALSLIWENTKKH